MKIEIKSRILCQDCGCALPIGWKQIADGAKSGPIHFVWKTKGSTVCTECPACRHRQRVELLLIKPPWGTRYAVYQLRRGESQEEGMHRVMDALHKGQEPEPVFSGRYWGRE